MEPYAELDPRALRAEDGSCATCPARDGCTHACPALGWAMARDLRGVPSSVCRLVRAQVAAVGAHLRRAEARPSRVGPGALGAAAIALATAACGGAISVPPPVADAGAEAAPDAAEAVDPGDPWATSDDAAYDAADTGADAGHEDGMVGGGGLCPPPGLC